MVNNNYSAKITLKHQALAYITNILGVKMTFYLPEDLQMYWVE